MSNYVCACVFTRRLSTSNLAMQNKHPSAKDGRLQRRAEGDCSYKVLFLIDMVSMAPGQY